jgi:O-antigen/teichoic acid export membrane protein
MDNIGSSPRNRYLTNTTWLMAEKIVRMAVSLLVGVYVARYLGPAQFGMLSYAVSLVALFSPIAGLGLEEIVVRRLVENPDGREMILGAAFLLRILGSLVLLGMLGAVVYGASLGNNAGSLVMIIAGGILFQCFHVIDCYFQSRVLARMTSATYLGAMVIASVLKVLLVLGNAPLIWFAVAYSLENLFAAVFFVFMYSRSKADILAWRFEMPAAFALLKESWPMAFSGVVVMVYMRVDQVMIKAMINAEAVGQYAAAVQLSEAWYFIPVAINTSLFPAILNARRASQEVYYARLQKLYDSMVWLAVGLALPISLFAKEIVSLLFGGNYAPSGAVLQVHIWTGVFVFLGVASGKWYIAEDLARHSFFRALCGALLNVLLNLLLIPGYGILGAAIATLAAQFGAAYLYDATNRRTRVCFKMKTKSLFPVHLIGGS